jgi:type II secretory pathway pseudopilin PulG
MTAYHQTGRKRERGYILIILLLAVALSAIFALTWVQKIDFQIKRDQEEELIHRGVQYSRAVKRYFKKFGRYPTKIEDLENTNNLRFLRKRFKDPITGKDFKPLRFTDVRTSFNSPGAGLTPVSQMNAARQNSLNSPFMSGTSTSVSSTSANGVAAATTGGQPDAAGPASAPTDVSAGNQQVSQSSQSSNDNNGPASPPPAGLAAGPQVFGGAGIVGVVSLSKLKTIREFNKKDHYNQWQFIYDPSSDRGGLLMTPNQPPLMGSVQNQQQQSQNGETTPQTFGSGPGMNPVNPTPHPPEQNPQQQPDQQ